MDQSWNKDGEGAVATRPRIPGVVLVFSPGMPKLEAFALENGVLEIGREGVCKAVLEDTRMSRQHARVAYDGRTWMVQDLGSRNGTAVDGELIRGEIRGDNIRVVRTGDSLFIVSPDISMFQASMIETPDGMTLGPTMAAVWLNLARIARSTDTLHITGESGTGKELAARAFHRLGPHQQGPFIAVNCAAIPQGMAERLLFGTRRGAYSGADADAEGYVQAANSGTLFLDEVADLDLGVQAKLLRVLENREVLALGASRAQSVKLQICSATHKDLRAQIAEKRLREDLYFRIGRPEVCLPPLRSRLEEIPWLLRREVAKVNSSLALHASLVETAMLRHWPGNVRELITEARAAAHAAIAVDSMRVLSEHLHARAGQALTSNVQAMQVGTDAAIGDTATGQDESAGSEGAARPRQRPVASADRVRIEGALQAEGGNVTSTARVLGMHRTQLRRLITRLGIDTRKYALEDDGD